MFGFGEGPRENRWKFVREPRSAFPPKAIHNQTGDSGYDVGAEGFCPYSYAYLPLVFEDR
jgi:hypothetical protein